jgi:CTP synthase (UTP-ammonia lyase)
MDTTINIGIIGDFDPGKPSHVATNAAIEHAAGHLKIKTKVTWLPTPSFLSVEGQSITPYDAVWVSPGSPYLSAAGAIEGIKLAREAARPLIGT